jgi:hypothetical protein
MDGGGLFPAGCCIPSRGRRARRMLHGPGIRSKNECRIKSYFDVHLSRLGMPVKTVQQRQTFEDLVAAKRRFRHSCYFLSYLCVLLTSCLREQSMTMQALVARPATAPAAQKQMPAAGIPTRGIDSPKLKQFGPAPSYANPTLASSRKGSRTNSETTTAISTPRPRSQSSHASSELYALAHDFFAGTASSNAKIVSTQQLQVISGTTRCSIAAADPFCRKNCSELGQAQRLTPQCTAQTSIREYFFTSNGRLRIPIILRL